MLKLRRNYFLSFFLIFVKDKFDHTRLCSYHFFDEFYLNAENFVKIIL